MSPNLLYSTEEHDLRASVRSLLADRCQAEHVLATCETEPADVRLWRTLASELGATSLHVPEDVGGQGATVRELAVVAEELGRSVAPVPFLGSAVLATTALLAVPPCESRNAALGALARGERTATMAMPFTQSVQDGFATDVTSHGATLTGSVSTVADGQVADLLVVPATADGAPGLWLVDVAREGVTVSPVTSFDLTRPVADIDLREAAAEPLAGGDDAAVALTAALHVGAGVLAAEQVGITEWCLDTTVEYVKQRYQFGRPVGSYQALKHRIADLWYQLVVARATARYAADQLATGGPDVAVATGMAQSLCAPVARRAAEECIQLHGGIGMTWEHPAHLYLKRAKADEVALGKPSAHREVLGPQVNLHPVS
ncbi:acyl-CoA dehydrogenase family protein [Haloechinothrix sp. LS1_15]|uniref:acyl-CoA dehydrogenase family protein n=1 Tax=Haloechinothrix sp. LS1_15 TaxID=2652248 RepID=UPI00294AF890|nr:acyl-CoA dehydrogenase family protein [Haloechinothrix sp. LS1_15]